MKSLKLFLLFFSLVFNATILSGQELKTQSVNEGNIADQFEFVLRKSSNWNDERGQAYEVIKTHLILSLRSHVLDSLKSIQNALNLSNTTVRSQQQDISNLTTNLSKVKDTLAATNPNKDSMNLFGLQMSKSKYNLLMWGSISALLVLLLVFILKFKNSNLVTKIARDNLATVEESFEEHRRIALEREQKVRRQLQDEINKHKG